MAVFAEEGIGVRYVRLGGANVRLGNEANERRRRSGRCE